MIKYVNHKWEINKYRFREIAQPIGPVGDLFQLIRNGVRYAIPSRFVMCYVPLGVYYIEIGCVNKFMRRVNHA